MSYKWRFPDQLCVYKGPPKCLTFQLNNLPQLNYTNMGPTLGPWRLRYIIDKEPGSVPVAFATSHGIDKVVTIDPEGGDEQKVWRFHISFDCMINLVTVPQWYAVPVDEKEETYIITPDPAAISLSLTRKGTPAGNNTVILAQDYYKWRLDYLPINLAGGNVYRLAFLLDFTFRRTDLFRKGSRCGVSWSPATSWEGERQQRGKTQTMAT